jgi:threonine/homoserine/homoserine lactone efflux protein
LFVSSNLKPTRSDAAGKTADGRRAHGSLHWRMIPHAVWPVEPTLLGPFLIAALLIELTPGPNMAWLAMVAASRGRAAGLAAVAGVTLGLSVYLIAGSLGAAQALAQAPLAYQTLRWAGIAFLMWLAWEAYRAEPTPTAPSAAASSAFQRGLTTNLLNPKAALFYLTVVPAFVRPDHGAASHQIFLLGLLYLGVSVVVHGAIVLAAVGLSGRIAGGGLIDQRLSAAMLLAVAVWTAWASRH